MLVDRARGDGLQLTGEGGLLQQLTKRVLESALDGEITDHVGYDKHDPAGRDSGNTRNGTRTKTVLTDVGPVEVRVPRDAAGTFEPQIVRKRQRRLTGVDDMVLSLSAKGLTHGEIAAHLAEVYGAEVSKQTISTITDKVMDGMAEWQNRPLDRVYPVVFIDAINVKIRDGQVANRPIYVAMAVTVDGHRDILGHLGRRRRRGREVLAARAHRAEEPRRRRRADAVSSFNAVSRTVLVNCFSSPSGPVNDSPCSFAARTNSAAASASADGSGADLVQGYGHPRHSHDRAAPPQTTFSPAAPAPLSGFSRQAMAAMLPSSK